jgi:hypothetical protein
VGSAPISVQPVTALMYRITAGARRECAFAAGIHVCLQSLP